jgi:diguanylate cyclase (GGDEF)-like protein
LVVVRLVSGKSFSWAALFLDLRADSQTYFYLAVSTVVAFALFGFVVGRRADRLLDLSRTDPLTGLANARGFRERLEAEHARSLRYREPLSLLLIDLDGLKSINDRMGHPVGDLALLRLAAAIRDGARASDLGARYGGDEFVLLAPSTGSAAAAALAERIRRRVAEDEGDGLAVTASVGVATFDPAGPAGAALGLMDAADAALYRAKRSGGNCVAAAP